MSFDPPLTSEPIPGEGGLNLLTTGAGSGLGRFLHERLGGRGLRRGEEPASLERLGPLDVIIHCAFNSSRFVDGGNLAAYLDDNLFLTEKLSALPCRHFIYLSSIDVYPLTGTVHDEDEKIGADAVRSSYAFTKLAAEALLRRKCETLTILRPGLMLGPWIRPNSLTRILLEEGCEIGLSADSAFNCVLHEDVLEFIRRVIERKLTGTFNVVSRDAVELGEAARQFHRRVRFGSYRYRPDPVSNRKIAAVSGRFRKSSLHAIERFMEERA
jgi:nucleoside-diphosphate-sugar epimerase